MDDDLVLFCTSCKVVYLVSVLDHDGVGDTPVAAFCPYCGQRTVTYAPLDPIPPHKLGIVPGGKK